ncbi:MAG: type II secretion system protein [Terriglobales bacterium]
MRFRSKARTLKVSNPKAGSPRVPNLTARDRGFTLIEMLVVMVVIMIILAIAVPNYTHSVLLAKEAKLHQNLATLNKAITEYSLDKKQAPQSLEDLVPGYIKFIPEDITGKTDTWKLDPEDSEDAYDPNQIGIKSVHSGSDGMSTTGDPYSSWTH